MPKISVSGPKVYICNYDMCISLKPPFGTRVVVHNKLDIDADRPPKKKTILENELAKQHHLFYNLRTVEVFTILFVTVGLNKLIATPSPIISFVDILEE